MKSTLASIALCLLLFGLSVGEAEAKRMGGGRSMGTQREAVSSAPKPAPAHNAAQPSAPAAATAAAAQPKRSWLGPLAGLAAGIGLAALFSHFGMGAGIANFLLIALLAFAGIFIFRFIFRRLLPASTSSQPLHFAGSGGSILSPQPENIAANPSTVISGDAIRPIAVPRNIPSDFDTIGFIRTAKVNFIRLQAAHDACNLNDIRDFTTPEMFAEIKLDIDERQGRTQRTDVQSIDAELLEAVTEGDRHFASVHFCGNIKDEQDSAPQPFDEVWNLIKPTDGSRGWSLAGIQQHR